MLELDRYACMGTTLQHDFFICQLITDFPDYTATCVHCAISMTIIVTVVLKPNII